MPCSDIQAPDATCCWREFSESILQQKGPTASQQADVGNKSMCPRHQWPRLLSRARPLPATILGLMPREEALQQRPQHLLLHAALQAHLCVMDEVIVLNIHVRVPEVAITSCVLTGPAHHMALYALCCFRRAAEGAQAGTAAF